MSRYRFLCLGAGEGWHATQLSEAARRLGHELHHATYESLRASIDETQCEVHCGADPLTRYDGILTRTMPAGTLEQVTFRLAMLHSLVDSSHFLIVNKPRALEIAIDKFATLARVNHLGYPVPDTIVVQSRSDAMDAFTSLGGDCVIKPIFGGEGRGVMRIQDAELAWTTFSTLEQLGAVCYVQRFMLPGGSDTRLLVIGDTVLGIRRRGNGDFRTNVRSGGTSEPMEVDSVQREMALRICDSIGLEFASVDLIDSDDGDPKVLEVNGIPGWKGAQKVVGENIAEKVVSVLTNAYAEREADWE